MSVLTEASQASSPKNRRNIEAIYPLSPMQKALLFHSVGSEGGDRGFLQARFTLHGKLEVGTFEAAWQRVVERHAALRMSVTSTKDQQPFLVVWRSAQTPWTHQDLRSLRQDERSRWVADYGAEDRRRGLDLSQVPPARITLIRMEENLYRVIWTCHHLLLDGWSSSLVLQEVAGLYRAICNGEKSPLAPVKTSFRDYLAWSKQQELNEAKSFWQQKLQGFQAPTSLGAPAQNFRGEASRPDFEDEEVALDQELSSRIGQVATTYKLTPNALVQGAWILVLSGLSGDEDVVFGTTVSGRPADMTGIESIVGSFTNVLPVRAQVEPNWQLTRWIRKLRDEQFQLQKYEHIPLVEVNAWSEVPGSQPIFESLLVFENLPNDHLSTKRDRNDLQIVDYHSGVTSMYPLTVIISPGDRWSIRCIYQTDRFEATAISSLLSSFQALLSRITTDIEQPVSDALHWLEERSSSRNLAEDNGASASGIHPVPNLDGRNADSYHAPRTPCELELTKIWEENLGLHQIGVDEDFFALGGRSLVAVRMFTEIENRLDKRLSPTVLLEHPTIEQLAKVIQAGEASQYWQSLVPIQPNGSRIPLFCVHAGGGHVLYLRDLANHLGPDQPVYGLQPIGLDGKREPLTSVEDMASHYVEELRSLQPRGPYQLAGHCIGATISFEMAQQLRERGEQVSLLAVVDAGSPPFEEGVPVHFVRSKLGRMVQYALNREWRYIREGLGVNLQHFVQGLRWRWGFHAGKLESQNSVVLSKIQQACQRARNAYVAKPYPGPLTLIHGTMRSEEEFLGWSVVASEISRYEVPIAHRDVSVEPGVQLVAKTLSGLLSSKPYGPDPE